MSVIIQEEETGCGFAAVANIIGCPYVEVKAKANALGVFAEHEALYSGTQHVRRLLKEYGVLCSSIETPFTSWETLPDMALLSIKYHEENSCFFWHWVVFKRQKGVSVVLDSAAYLKENERTDFNQMKPKWFIEISKT